MKTASKITDASTGKEKQALKELLEEKCVEVTASSFEGLKASIEKELGSLNCEAVTHFLQKTTQFLNDFKPKKDEKLFLVRRVFVELVSFKKKQEKAKAKTAKATEARKKSKEEKQRNDERNDNRYDNVVSIVTSTNQNQNQNQNQTDSKESVSQRSDDRRTFLKNCSEEEKSFYGAMGNYVQRTVGQRLPLQSLDPLLQRVVRHQHADVDHRKHRHHTELQVRQYCFQKALEEMLLKSDIENPIAYLWTAFGNNWREWMPPAHEDSAADEALLDELLAVIPHEEAC